MTDDFWGEFSQHASTGEFAVQLAHWIYDFACSCRKALEVDRILAAKRAAERVRSQEAAHEHD